MVDLVDYKAEHWTIAAAEADYKSKPPVVITVNDRAATRQAIINRVRHLGSDFVARSDWAAHKARPEGSEDDWDYSKIAIHHAGRSLSCGPAALQLQMIQEEHQKKPWPDIGYHYAVACGGQIFEGRDIRFKGTHLYKFNTGAIGIVLLENLVDADESSDLVGLAMRARQAFGYAPTADAPSEQQAGLNVLIDVLLYFFEIAQLGGHREFPHQEDKESRICPGNHGLKVVHSIRSRLGLAAPSRV